MHQKILLVDDEEDMLSLMEINFSGNGYEVFLAKNGTEALQKVKEADPDLVLIDVVLPDMDGYEVCKQVKETYKDKKVIIYTGKFSGVDARRALEVGADDFVVKTNDLNYLIESIKKLYK